MVFFKLRFCLFNLNHKGFLNYWGWNHLRQWRWFWTLSISLRSDKEGTSKPKNGKQREKVKQYIIKSQLFCSPLIIFKFLLVYPLEAEARLLLELLVTTLLLYLDLTYFTLVLFFQGLISTLEWLSYILLFLKPSFKKVYVVTSNRWWLSSLLNNRDVIPGNPLLQSVVFPFADV